MNDRPMHPSLTSPLMPSERKRTLSGRRRVSKAESPTAVVQTMLRMTEALRARIEEAADRNGNSLNAEMNRRIEQSFFLEDLLKARLISMRAPAAKPAEPA